MEGIEPGGSWNVIRNDPDNDPAKDAAYVDVG
jgi:hypothetical protein